MLENQEKESAKFIWMMLSKETSLRNLSLYVIL